MLIKYLVDTLTYDFNNVLRQNWHSTHDAIDTADIVYQALLSDKYCVGVALTQWQADHTGDLAHGSWAIRSCAGAIPSCTVLKHASRATAIYDPSKNMYTHGAWVHEGLKDLGLVSPAPGFRLSPAKITDNQQLFLKYAPKVKDKTCLVIYDNSLSLVDESEIIDNCLPHVKNYDLSVKKPSKIVKLYRHKIDFTLV